MYEKEFGPGVDYYISKKTKSRLGENAKSSGGRVGGDTTSE